MGTSHDTSRMYIAKKRTLYIFNGSSEDAVASSYREPERVVTVPFDVNCLGMNRDGTALAVGGQKSKLHLYLADGTLAFSYPLTLGKRKSTGADAISSVEFVSTKNQVEEDLVIVLHSKQLIILCGLNMNEIIQACEGEQKAKALKAITQRIIVRRQTLADEITCDPPFLIQHTKSQNSIAMHVSTTGVPSLDYLVAPSNTDTGFEKIESLSPLLLSQGVQKMACSDNLLFLVDGRGLLSIWDASTLLLLFQWEETYRVYDFQLISRNTEDRMIEFALLTDSDADAWMFRICRISSLTNYSEVYSEQVIRSSSFVRQNKASKSGVYILTIPTADRPSKCDCLISVCEEVTPGIRFDTLIESNKFEDAITFANQMGMPKEQAYQLYLSHILQQDKINEEHLRSILETTGSSPELIQECIATCLPTYSDTMTVLSILNDVAHSELVENTIWRFTTYQLLSEGEFNASQWQTFRTANLVDVMIQFITAGSTRSVYVLWARHINGPVQTDREMLLSRLPEILDVIPPTASLKPILDWLRLEVLSIICTPDILQWIERYARVIERSFGAKEAKSVTELIFTARDMRYDPINQTNCIEAVSNLHSQLAEIVHLDETFGLSIQLDSFNEITARDIGIAIFDHIGTAEVIEAEMERSIKPYFQRKQLELSELLFEMIKENSKSMDQAKAITLIRVIPDADTRGAAALTYLRSLNPPYSDDIRDLAAELTSWKCKWTEELIEQKRLMGLQEMFGRYGIRNFDLANSLQARRLLNHITAQIQNPMAYDDAMQLTEAFSHLQKSRTVLKILQNILFSAELFPFDEAFDRISSIIEPMEKNVKLEYLSFCERLLNQAPNVKTDHVSPVRILASALMEHLQAADSVEQIRKVRQLQKEFHLDVSYAVTFQDILAIVPDEDILRTIATLFGYSRTELRVLLAIRSAKAGQVGQAVRFTREVLGSSLKATSIDLLRQLALSLVSFSPSFDAQLQHGLSKSQHDMALCPVYARTVFEIIITTCPSSELLNMMNWYRRAFLFCQMYQQTVTGSYVMKKRNSTNGILLSTEPVMGYVTKFLKAQTDAQYDKTCRQLVKYLIESDATFGAILVLLFQPERLPETGIHALSTQFGKLVLNVLQSPTIDCHFAFGLFVSMPKKAAYEAFFTQLTKERAYEDYARLEQIGIIGSDVARAWQEMAFLHQCTELIGNAKWWHQLRLLAIPFESKWFQNDTKESNSIKRLLPVLLEKTNGDLETVLAFARDYQMEESFPCLLYLERVLLHDDQYKRKLSNVLDSIHQTHLIQVLVHLFPKISSFDYPRLKFVLNLLLQTEMKEKEEILLRLELLQLLETYHSTRLPFHELLDDPWDVLQPELTEQTVGRLVAFSGPLQLDPDEFYMRLARLIVKEHAIVPGESSSNAESKRLKQGTSEQIQAIPFQRFESIISSLRDTENAITIAEWIASLYPVGIIKSQALEFALQLVEETPDSERTSSFTGHEAVRRLTSKMAKTQTMFVLQEIEGDTESLAVMYYDRPKELLKELYRSFSLVYAEKKTKDSDQLHHVADSIGVLFNVSMRKIRRELVEQWLMEETVAKTNRIGTSTATTTSVFEKDTYEQRVSVDQDYVKRILYMCFYFENDIRQDIVAKLKHFSKSSGSYRSKYRALQVLEALTSEIQPHVKAIEFMIELEEMRFPHTLTQLQLSDPLPFIRGLLQDHADNNPRLVHLLARIALDSELNQPLLWKNLLCRMKQLKMYRALLNLLPQIARKRFLTCQATLLPIWQSLIEAPIQELMNLQRQRKVNACFDSSLVLSRKRAAPEDETDQDPMFGLNPDAVQDVLTRMISSLMQCPFIHELKFQPTVQALKTLGFSTFAKQLTLNIPDPLTRQELLTRL